MMIRINDENIKAEALLDDIEQHMFELFCDSECQSKEELIAAKSEPEEGEITDNSDTDKSTQMMNEQEMSISKVKHEAGTNTLISKNGKRKLRKGKCGAFKDKLKNDYDKIDFNQATGRYNWDKDLCKTEVRSNTNINNKRFTMEIVKAEVIYCNFCGESFSSYFDLEIHILTFSKNDHCFSCRNCGKCEFRLLLNIYSHGRKCPNFSAFDKAERGYAKENPNVTQYYCDFCGKGFGILQEFLLHKSRNHKNMCVSCHMCFQLDFSNWNALFCHMRRHSLIGNLDLRCRHCSLHFYAISYFRNHLRFIHNDEDQQNILYECCLCQAVFINNEPEFVHHVHRHRNYLKVEDQDFAKIAIKNGLPLLFQRQAQCVSCAEVFPSNFKLAVHEKRKHPDRINLVPCGTCQSGYPKNQINDHLLYHQKKTLRKTANKLKKEKNQIKNKSDTFKKKITEHEVKQEKRRISNDNDQNVNEYLKKKKIIHPAQMLSKCNVCEMNILRDDFEKHKAEHENKTPPDRNDLGDNSDDDDSESEDEIKTFCQECKKNIPVDEFQAHQEIHEEGVTIKCTECNTVFDTIKNLMIHRKIYHFSKSPASKIVYEPPRSIQCNASQELQKVSLMTPSCSGVIQNSVRQQNPTLMSPTIIQLPNRIMNIAQRSPDFSPGLFLSNQIVRPLNHNFKAINMAAHTFQLSSDSPEIIQDSVNQNRSSQSGFRFEPPISVQQSDHNRLLTNKNFNNRRMSNAREMNQSRLLFEPPE